MGNSSCGVRGQGNRVHAKNAGSEVARGRGIQGTEGYTALGGVGVGTGSPVPEGNATSIAQSCVRLLIFRGLFLMFIFEKQRERERDRAQVGEGQKVREGDTESEAASRL